MVAEGPGAGSAGRAPIVFLSYSRADKAQAVRLAKALQGAGLDVWWDTLIEGGAEFAKTIEAAINTCDAVVVAWSQASVSSDWVLDEAARGRELHRLVPVSLDGTEPPMGFRRYHSIDLTGWKGDAGAAEIDAIVRGVAALPGRGSPSPAIASVGPVAKPRTVSRRRLLLGAGVAGVAGVAGLVVWRNGLHLRLLAASGNSVAVLPFKNLGGDRGQDYFSEGLAEEVRATLARNVGLLVMAQASSAKFRDSKDDATSIAEQLGVAYLLDGSVRRSGDVVRVAADLIDGSSGFSRWSQTFERRISDIFAVQSEIATTVANALATRVAADSGTSGSAADVVAAGGTVNLAAFDAYLRGRALYDLAADEASEAAALAQFDAAIAADPEYAAAHAARARSLTTMANQYGDVSRRAGLYDAAIAAAERAIALAPDLADAHSTLGYTLFQGRMDARAARAPFERSAQSGSGEATVLARYAQYSARTGRDDEAVTAIKRALRLDPLNPLIYRAAGSVEYAARRYAESILPLRKALEMNPKMGRAHASIGDALLMLGKVAEARVEYALEPAMDFNLAGIAIAEHRLGDVTAARAAFDRLRTELGDRSLYQQAQVLAQMGDRDAAITALEQARAVGDGGLIYARNDPMLDPLRGDPRFARLLQGMGFDGGTA
jgi:TolB-like protein/tetratricopeptide (TPR) repeat protein